MSGADRYAEVLSDLRDIRKEKLTVDQRIAVAQVEATLAVAGAVALGVVTPFVGDSEDITDWARMIAVTAVRTGPRARGERAAF